MPTEVEKSFGSDGKRPPFTPGIPLPNRRDDENWDDKNDDGKAKLVLEFIG